MRKVLIRGVLLKHIAISYPIVLFHEVERECEQRQISISDWFRRAGLEFQTNHPNLDKTELLFAQTILKDERENMIEYLRSKNAKKMTIIRSIRNVVYRMKGGGNWIDKKDLIENLKFTLQVCELQKWKKEVKIIKEMIKELRMKKLDEKKVEIFYQEAKQLKETDDAETEIDVKEEQIDVKEEQFDEGKKMK